MAFHYTVRWTPPQNVTDLYGYGFKFDQIMTLGRHGVEIFFVISGLVITMTVLRSQNAIDFAAHRIARIYPALIVSAAITLALCQFAPPALRREPLDFLASLTLHPRLFGRTFVDGAYGTLAVEMKFYAYVAASFFVLKQRFWIGLLVAAGASLALSFNHFAEMLLFPHYWPYFLIGMAGWYGLFEKQLTPTILLSTSGLLLLAIYYPGPSPTMLVMLATVLMAWMIHARVTMPLLPALGRISYSLYLIHQNLGVMMIGKLTGLGLPGLAALALTVGSLTLAAFAMHRLVELPGQRLFIRAYLALKSSTGKAARAPVEQHSQESAQPASARPPGIEAACPSADPPHIDRDGT